jgi:hypothetical protein
MGIVHMAHDFAWVHLEIGQRNDILRKFRLHHQALFLNRATISTCIQVLSRNTTAIDVGQAFAVT